MSRPVFACLPDNANKIVVPGFLIVRSKEGGGGDDGSDLDQIGISWLAVFVHKVFSCCFEERGKFFRRNSLRAGLSEFS